VYVRPGVGEEEEEEEDRRRICSVS
jgi:hypothetical protein